MRILAISLLCILIGGGLFSAGTRYGERRAQVVDDLWWAHVPNANYYGVQLSRDPSCRNDLETCIKALDCQTSARIDGLRAATQSSAACQAAWRLHPAVLQPANPAIRETARAR